MKLCTIRYRGTHENAVCGVQFLVSYTLYELVRPHIIRVGPVSTSPEQSFVVPDLEQSVWLFRNSPLVLEQSVWLFRNSPLV